MLSSDMSFDFASLTLRYAQDERFRIPFLPFVLSVARPSRAESKDAMSMEGMRDD